MNIPKRGDIVMANLNPVSGHEQKGFRPLLVISHDDFNLKTRLIVICPITSKVKGTAFEVPFVGSQINGVVLTHQVRTIDLEARKVTVCDKVDDYCLQEVIRKVNLIINSHG
ncbi:MAG: type II toxin-antitoxin system PemK/MazF family toxin [Patescibacteria group bacterium]